MEIIDTVLAQITENQGAGSSGGRLRKRKIKHVKPGEVAVAA